MSRSRGYLEIDGLSIDFPTEAHTLHAVVDASMRLEREESLGIVGESGSGKTLTAMAVLGLVPRPGRVVAGEVWFDGRNLLTEDSEELRRTRGREIGMIFQDPSAYLNPVQTIGQQIAEPLLVHQLATRREARRKTIELLEMVGIPQPSERVGSYPHQFSGGMRQRVLIAIALACRPSLLIADEPTSALDVTIQAQLVDLLVSLKSELGMSLVLITHDAGLVAGLVDRIAVMYAGRVVETGGVDELFDAPSHPYTAALLASTPRLDRPIGSGMKVIRGSPPDPFEIPSGCPFRTRCDRADDTCAEAFPSSVLVGPGHEVCCWYPIVGFPTVDDRHG